jgi:hypothetical protein
MEVIYGKLVGSWFKLINRYTLYSNWLCEMKLNEIKPIVLTNIEAEQLDEVSLKNLAAAGALGLGIAASPGAQAAHHKAPTHKAPMHQTHHQAQHKPVVKKDPHVATGKIDAQKAFARLEAQREHKQLVSFITAKYRVSPERANQVLKAVDKYADPVFPAKKDLLAIIGIESSYDPNKKSGLKYDPAVGLTQVRPKIWGIDANDLSGNVDKQVLLARNILKKYYNQFQDKDAAIHAYNVGETNYRHQQNLNPEYVHRFKKELNHIMLVTKPDAPLSTVHGKNPAHITPEIKRM